jgi:hypothetical protein
MLILNRYFSIVYGGMGFNHNRYVFFGLLLFTESMPQQVKESQSMDQQYFKRKDTATAIGNYSAFKAFSPCWPVPWQD